MVLVKSTTLGCLLETLLLKVNDAAIVENAYNQVVSIQSSDTTRNYITSQIHQSDFSDHNPYIKAKP